MPKNRRVRLFYALAVIIALVLIGRNLYYRIVNHALVAAVRIRDVSAVRRLLAHGADPNCRFSNLLPDGQPLPQEPLTALAFSKLRESTNSAPIAPGPTYTNAEEIVLLLVRHGARLQDRNDRNSNYLNSACLCGDVTLVREMLDRGLDPNASGNAGVLSTAIDYDDVLAHRFAHTPDEKVEMARRHEVSRQLVRLLREHGAQLSLTQAQTIGDTATVRKLVANGGPSIAQEGYDALCTAADSGDVETIRQLLQRGINPNPPRHDNPLPHVIALASDDDVPLDAAASKGHIEAAKLLLAHGADPNLSTANGGMSALACAAREGRLDMVQLLLAHGAKINLPSLYSPLMMAISGKHPAIMRYLLQKGASVATPPNSASVLALALCDLPEVVPDLRKHGVPVNLPPGLTVAPRNLYSKAPYSPLMAAVFYVPQYEMALVRAGAKIGPDRSIICVTAARQKRMDLLPKLLAYGADINGADAFGDTALSVCVESAPRDVKTLLEHGAKPNVLSRELRTPLQAAALAGNTEVVRLLLAHGAQVNAHTAHGHTPLYWAHRKNHSDIVALLQQVGGRE
jgi:uncharacterized protein